MRMHTEHSLEKFYYSMEETLSRKMGLVKIVLMSGQVKWESTKETGTNIKNRMILNILRENSIMI